MNGDAILGILIVLGFVCFVGFMFGYFAGRSSALGVIERMNHKNDFMDVFSDMMKGGQDGR